jgi:branched-chain amino acid transport system substrate-binding protein
MQRRLVLMAGIIMLSAVAGSEAFAQKKEAFAQKKYDTGATDTEIKFGNIMPYSGPASAYAVIGAPL